MPEKSQLPIATATIARLYMVQGKLDQAEAIYRELLKDGPDDQRLLDGLAEVQRQHTLAQAPTAEDRLALRREGNGLRCLWSVTDAGQRRAQLLLAGPSRLVLRLMPFPANPQQPAHDSELASLTGESIVPLPPGAQVLAAAVGLHGPDRFVSIVHCCFVVG